MHTHTAATSTYKQQMPPAMIYPLQRLFSHWLTQAPQHSAMEGSADQKERIQGQHATPQHSTKTGCGHKGLWCWGLYERSGHDYCMASLASA